MITTVENALLKFKPLETPNGRFVEIEIRTAKKLFITLPAAEAIKAGEILIALASSKEAGKELSEVTP